VEILEHHVERMTPQEETSPSQHVLESRTVPEEQTDHFESSRQVHQSSNPQSLRETPGPVDFLSQSVIPDSIYGSGSDVFFGSEPQSRVTSFENESLWNLQDVSHIWPDLSSDQNWTGGTANEALNGTPGSPEKVPRNTFLDFAALLPQEVVLESQTLPSSDNSQQTPHESQKTQPSPELMQLYRKAGKREPYRLNGKDQNWISQGIIELLRLDDTNENRCLVATAVARGHNIRDVMLSGLQSLGDKTALPDVHKNSLRLVRNSTKEAFLTIALAAGVHIPDLYLETMPSPFYRSNVDPSTVQTLVAQYKTSNIPTDMHPTAAQILTPHRPWVDLLPFPTLRERAIQLSSITTDH
jgi:hypothetical protein